MKKIIAVSLLILTSCASSNRLEHAVETPEPLPDFSKPSTDAAGVIPTEPKITEPVESPQVPTVFSVSAASKPASVEHTTIVTKVYGGTEAQRQRFLKIAGQVEQVINSEKFKTRLLSNKYKGKLGFYQSSATPKEVLEKMLKADEFNKGKPDHIWQYELYITRLPRLVYGRMYWPKPPIYFNDRYLDKRASSGLAGTFCHEKAHQLGYTHKDLSSKRQFSVPYTVGTVCAEVYKAMGFK